MPQELSRSIGDIPPPYFHPEAPTLEAWLAERADAEGRTVAEANTPAARLQYYLVATMGSPNAFEYRRQELAAMRGGEGVVSDTDVFDSYVESVTWPGGVVARYVSRTQPALLLGNTLCVHGALNPLSLGFVPHTSRSTDHPDGCQEGDYLLDQPLAAWVEALNGKWQAAVEDWKARPAWDPLRTSRGGEGFFGYSYSAATAGRSVIVTTFVPDGNPELPDAAVGAHLAAHGVRRVLVGHKPFGDAPQVLQDTVHGVHYVLCDTSYSNPERGGPRRSPHVAYTVTVEGGLDGANQMVLHGALHSQVRYESVVAIEEPGLVGRRTADGWWVKCHTAAGTPGAEVLLTRGQGYTISSELRPTEEVEGALVSPNPP